jgi:ankyrin repeat protein
MTKDYPTAEGEWANLGGLPTPQRVRLVTALLNHGADVHARLSKLPPRFGWSFNMMLLAPGNVVSATPFLLAAMGAEVDVMRLLVARGADPKALIANKTPANNTTALMLAAGIGTPEEESNVPHARRIAAAELCLELGVPIDAQNDAGWAAVHVTAAGGLDEVLKFLIKRGANLALKTERGQTPLSVAEGIYLTTNRYVHEGAAKILRAAGAPK